MYVYRCTQWKDETCWGGGQDTQTWPTFSADENPMYKTLFQLMIKIGLLTQQSYV